MFKWYHGTLIEIFSTNIHLEYNVKRARVSQQISLALIIENSMKSLYENKKNKFHYKAVFGYLLTSVNSILKLHLQQQCN